MDLQQIITSVASGCALALLLWIVSLIKSWIKKNEEREQMKDIRMGRYFMKTDAILYAIAVTSDKIEADAFQKVYNKKMEELEKEDEMLKIRQAK